MLKLNNKKVPFNKTFRGSAENGLCILTYLTNKFKNACVILPQYKSNKSLNQSDISLRWSQSDKFIVPEGYWSQFKKCSRKRFIIFPFGFDCSSGYGHANYMIYDKSTRSLERFDPYGKSTRTCLNPNGLDAKIKALFNSNLGSDFIQVYYSPLDFLSKKGIQQRQEDEDRMTQDDPKEGYCKAWCCWFVETRLQNPDIDRTKITKLAIEQITKDLSLTEYIRNYSQVVLEQC